VEEIIQLVTKTYGLVGLLLVAPIVAVVYQWKQNNKLHAEVIKATQESTEAQKQRVADAQAISNKLLDVVSEQSALNKETNIALDQVRELLMFLSKSHRSPKT
jgi:hypothetical protein